MAGTLSVTITPVAVAVATGAAFAGSGALDVASMVPVVKTPTAFTSAGALTAPTTASYSRSAPLAGTGALSATDTQKYAVAANLTGAASLTAVMTGTVNLQIVGTPVAVQATSIALPPHAVGDIIIIAATGNSLPTKPTAAGTVPAWTDIDSATGGGGPTLRSARFVATATNHTSGTWASAQAMAAIVLRGQNASPIGGHLQANNSVSSTNPSAPAITMTKTDGTSILLHIYAVAGPNLVWDAVPAGYTRQVSVTNSSNVCHLCINSKNVTTSDGAIVQTVDSGLGHAWHNASIEILK